MINKSCHPLLLHHSRIFFNEKKSFIVFTFGFLYIFFFTTNIKLLQKIPGKKQTILYVKFIKFLKF